MNPYYSFFLPSGRIITTQLFKDDQTARKFAELKHPDCQAYRNDQGQPVQVYGRPHEHPAR